MTSMIVLSHLRMLLSMAVDAVWLPVRSNARVYSTSSYAPLSLEGTRSRSGLAGTLLPLQLSTSRPLSPSFVCRLSYE
jgi:hypothetical protein